MTQSGRRKPLSGKIKKSLEKKAEDSRFYYGELARVYRKGQGAYLSAGSRNVSMEAWAMGRVNSYMTGQGGARAADKAIYAEYQKKEKENNCEKRSFKVIYCYK